MSFHEMRQEGSSRQLDGYWAWSWLVARPLPPFPLTLAIRTRALDGDANQRTPVGDHRSAILVPIRMFPGQTTIIIYERFHGVG